MVMRTSSSVEDLRRSGGSLLQKAISRMVEMTMHDQHEFYLPPISEVSVTIAPKSAFGRSFQASPRPITVLADLVSLAVQAVPFVPQVSHVLDTFLMDVPSECGQFAAAVDLSGGLSLTSAQSVVTGISDCLLAITKNVGRSVTRLGAVHGVFAFLKTSKWIGLAAKLVPLLGDAVQISNEAESRHFAIVQASA
jgi:hypothetical protein